METENLVMKLHNESVLFTSTDRIVLKIGNRVTVGESGLQAEPTSNGSRQEP